MVTRGWHVYVHGRKYVYDTVYINAKYDVHYVTEQLKRDGYRSVRKVVKEI